MKRAIYRILRTPLINYFGAWIAKGLMKLGWLGTDFVFPYRGSVYLPAGGKRGPFKMWSDGADTISARLKVGGIDNYEAEVRPVFEDLVAGARTFIDVGANSGFYSIVAWAVNPDCKVYALEPFPKACEILKQNIAINSASSIRLHQLAASNKTRTGSFFVPKAIRISTGGSEFKSQAEECDEIPARFICLDDFVQSEGLTEVDLLKIDTEYTEPLVIEGAKTLLETFRPSILIEILCDTHGAEIQKQFQEINYDFFQLRPEGPTPLENLSLGAKRDTNCNFLLVPREKTHLKRHEMYKEVEIQ